VKHGDLVLDLFTNSALDAFIELKKSRNVFFTSTVHVTGFKLYIALYMHKLYLYIIYVTFSC